MPNIYDISERSGVSIATVSRVLNGSPKVSEATKSKVLAVMDELGYTPNVFARGLGLNTMNTVGIMCSDSSDPFLANAVYYLEQNLRKHGYDSFLCCTGYELKNKKNYLELILSKRVDGLILVGSSLLEPKDEDDLYIKEAASRVPVMLMNG
ncbi:MAG: LacI family DNA-binding transcriptional regulator, partial [Lachnospiraceae bacterium]|nr:LacI family DNA-binding transcriptional regulator [Lachnospiraceae bacterium]